jgi:hypothetical protein
VVGLQQWFDGGLRGQMDVDGAIQGG